MKSFKNIDALICIPKHPTFNAGKLPVHQLCPTASGNCLVISLREFIEELESNEDEEIEAKWYRYTVN